MFCGGSPPPRGMTPPPATVGTSSQPAQSGAGASALPGGAFEAAGAEAMAAGGTDDAGVKRRHPTSTTASATTEAPTISQSRDWLGAGGGGAGGGGAGGGSGSTGSIAVPSSRL